MAGRNFDRNRGDLKIVLERGGSVSCVETAIFAMGVEVTEILGSKIGGIENATDQAINLTLGLGSASSVCPTHQPPDRHIRKWPGGVVFFLI